MTSDNQEDEDAKSRKPPDADKLPRADPITPAAPESFGQVQLWWGNGKGKTTAALGMGFRAAGHGYRVHMLQFMKGGASSVEATRGEYNAIAAMTGFTYENTGHYGWHAFRDGSTADDHAAKARGAIERTRELLTSSSDADLQSPLDLEAPPEEGVHMLILDEILYAANRDLVDPADVIELINLKPEPLELVLTGGHEKPAYLSDYANLITNVRKEKHPFDQGYSARKGTEY